MELDFPFKGSWLVNYDAKEFNYHDILINLAKIKDYFEQNGIIFNSFSIKFNKNTNKNYFFKENDAVLLNFRGTDKEFAEISAKPCDPAVFRPLAKPIKTISLLFPRLNNDPRWKTMGLPAGQLFLTSCLRSEGFEATPLTLALPFQNWAAETLAADMAGFTLFEDLLPVLGPFLADFRSQYMGIMAAGGPFPTLAPLAAIYHLPQVNLFVRGEAELVLPKILRVLNQGDAEAFFNHEGIFWQQPGLIAMAGFDQVNRPDDFSTLAIDLDFLQAEHLQWGLEMNFSRGCGRGCLFCCRAQGTKFRKLPMEKAGELLKKYSEKAAGTGSGFARALNINDDDILQDPTYAGKIFKLIKGHGFRIFGVQTSTASLVKSDGSPNMETLALVSDPELYVENRPLLWLGTDTFLPRRAGRLGKRLPPVEKFRKLLRELEKRGLRHFHYWISSDNDSSWEEFVEEITLIFGFFRDFPRFGLLAHAPFVVPYLSSRLFEHIEPGDPCLKFKLTLDAPDPRFNYKVVEQLETSWPQLNNLLKNEKAGGAFGFLDLLKVKEFIAAAQLAYHFLKQEQFQSSTNDPSLQRARERLEQLISEILRV